MVVMTVSAYKYSPPPSQLRLSRSGPRYPITKLLALLLPLVLDSFTMCQTRLRPLTRYVLLLRLLLPLALGLLAPHAEEVLAISPLRGGARIPA